MKIIASSKINFCFTEGILLVLSKLGHECIVWDEKRKPFFNMIDEQSPDVLFLTEYEKNWAEKLAQEKNTIVKMFGADNIKPYANTIKLGGARLVNLTYSYDVVYFSDNKIGGEQINFLKQISKKYRLGVFGRIRLPLYEYIGVDVRTERTSLIYNCNGGIDFQGWSYLDFALFNKPCLTFFHNDIFSSVPNQEIVKVSDRKDFVYSNGLTDCHAAANIFSGEITQQCLNLLG